MRTTWDSVAGRLLLSGVAVLTLFAADPNPTSWVAAEIRRIEQASKQTSPPDPATADIASSAQASLKAAEEALHSGRFYLALERLAQATDLFEGVQEIAAKTDSVQSGMPAFEAEWAGASQELATLSRQVQAAKWSRSPAAVHALSEASLGRSVPLLDGGRGFAIATGPHDGLFYVGEARGEARFANFCASLPPARKRRPWTARSLLPELLALQAKVDAAFQPPRSIEQHPRFIALNSTIKLARELDSARSYYGALYEYLEAVRHFAMLDAAPVDPARQPELKTIIDQESRKRTGSSRDDSILELFLQRAASQAAHPDGSAPTADEWRSAQAIVTRVVPAYDGAMKAAPPLSQTTGKTVDITLVRWPYT